MSSAQALPRADETGAGGFFGHPKGLAYLAFTEAWERFSYYGMSALLVLYMVDQLLLPGHVGHVFGFAAFRHSLESVFGPLSTQALASQIFGLYSGFVYFTPVLGGWIADRWIGQRSAVVLGALSMSGGHIAMAFDQSFLVALVLLVVGSGLLKGNISAQVGGLYPPIDEARRTRGFAIFSTAINFGAVVGPLACGFLGERFGWHVGFAAAAVFMLGGFATYLSGYRHLPVKVERKMLAKASLTRSDWKVVAALVAVMGIAVFQSIAYYQLANVLPVWLQQHGDMNAGGFLIPIPWYQSIDPLFSILFVPVLFALWRSQDRHGGEPSELGKIGQGAWICTLANLILVASIVAAGSHQVLWIWPLVYCALQVPRLRLLLADPARSGVAFGSRENQCDHDGDLLFDPVCLQQPDRVDRHLLRAVGALCLLVPSRRDRRCRRHPGSVLRSDSQARPGTSREARA